MEEETKIENKQGEIETTKPNPYGANSAISDPREQDCWDYYVKSILNNRPNAYQSALSAGYEESTATTITTRDWFKERLQKLKRKDMLSKAERNLDKVLDLDENNKEINPQLLKIKTDVSVTVVKTLGKEHYSERQETDLNVKIIEGIKIEILK